MNGLIELFAGLPRELATMLTAMLPIGELRLSIPVALGVYKLSIFSSYFFAVIGNIIPVIFLLLFLEPGSRWLIQNSKIFNRFFSWLFARTRDKHLEKFELLGAIALITLVALPVPLTGAWTGTVAAFVFGVPFWRALLYISVGVGIAGFIVTLASLGFFAII
ncbi:MAG TPA: small multi-drug export protein [Patescibacteria group bacterium]